MASIRTKFAVGLFFSVGLVIGVVAVIWLGYSRVLGKGRNYVAYFDQSVQGLQVDSPVKYRGVSIGRVTGIEVAPDAKLIQVRFSVESGPELEDANVVAQLQSVGITGIMYVELDRPPHGTPRQILKLEFTPPETVIPTRPSNLAQIIDDIEKIIEKVQRLDLEDLAGGIAANLDALKQAMGSFPLNEIGDKTVSVLAKADRLAGSDKWEGALEEVRQTGMSAQNLSKKAVDTLARLDRVIQRVEQLVAKNEPQVGRTLVALVKALESSSDFLRQGSAALETAGQSFVRMDHRLAKTLNDLDSAIRQLNIVIRSLSEQPSRLIFGVTPSSRELESK